MRGLIPQELARLSKVRAFTPNVHAQWQAEENERAFLEWCRKEEPRHLRDDLMDYVWVPWWKRVAIFFNGLIP